MHAPFPQPERSFLIERAARRLERPSRLPAVMGFVRDQVSHERNCVRLESLDLAASGHRLAQQSFDCSSGCFEGLPQLGFLPDRLGFQLRQTLEQGRSGRLQPEQSHVVDVREQIVYRAALGRQATAQCVVQDRVEQVEIDSIMDGPGFDDLFFHVNRQLCRCPSAAKEPAICRLFLYTMLKVTAC